METRKSRKDFELERALVNEVVKVVWDEIASMTDEASYNHIGKAQPISFTSYGIVLKDDSENLIMTSHVTNEKSNKLYREILTIHKNAIREIKILSEAVLVS